MTAKVAKSLYICHLNYPLIRVAGVARLMEEVTAASAWADIAAVVRPGVGRYLISIMKCSG